MPNKNQLTTKNNETMIDALARHNHIIKSLFHFDNQITFLVISLAIQKVRNITYAKDMVVITANEIKTLASGRNIEIGTHKLIKLIRKDIEKHNFFNFYQPNTMFKDIRTTLIKETSLTKDTLNLVIRFRLALFKTFKTNKNYTIQSLKQLRDTGENQRMILYSLTQPYAKHQKSLKLSVVELRMYLNTKDSYPQIRSLTLRVKRLCEKITKINDIDLTFEAIKSGHTTSDYIFYSKFKNQPKLLQQTGINDAQIILNTTISQQLKNWKVSSKQINIWLYSFDKKTLTAAINQTINRTINPNTKSNPGGYIYSILLMAKKSNNQTPESGLSELGISPASAKNAKDKLGISLGAVVTECLKQKTKLSDIDLRHHFNKLVDKYHNQLITSQAHTGANQ